MQELSEHLGIRLLNERLNDPNMQRFLRVYLPKGSSEEYKVLDQFLHVHWSWWYNGKPEGVLEEHAAPNNAAAEAEIIGVRIKWI